ncbi:g11123 [Coccomyxa elongata]
MEGTTVSGMHQDTMSLSESNIFQPTTLEDSTTLDKESKSTIVYATVGRAQYAFDIYSKAMGAVPAPGLAEASETRLTDGASVNYNGAFAGDDKKLLFVSERDGNMELYKGHLKHAEGKQHSFKRLTYSPSLQDRPLYSPDGRILFVSTHQPSKTPRQGWTAIYTVSGERHTVRRLTPQSDTDYSPAISADGQWLAAATGSGKTGESDIVVMRAADGLQRRVVAKNGGWPAFSRDGRSIFFHRQTPEGWWSIFKVELESGEVTRVTPPGIDVFTPATSKERDWVAVATPDQDGYRQIGALHVDENGEWALSQLTNRTTHHYNPFLSTDGKRVGYHRCRCADSDAEERIPVLTHHSSPVPDVDLVRIDGQFPSFSDDDRYIVHNDGFTGVAVCERDGSNKKTIYKAPAFGTTASYHDGRQVLATAQGPTFATEEDIVDIVLLRDGQHGEWFNTEALTLTANGTGNNAFPSFSSDGSEIVFRSGRSGYKNLYIMPTEGEAKGLIRLTEGPWDDTMPGWTPDSGWIVFASSREYATPNRPAGAFDIFIIRTDGSGLHKVFDSHGGLANHPHFSPDREAIVFTSDFAGYSAEEISTPHQFQPYGDIFTINMDGTGLRRLTHDPYENGTPAWGSEGTPQDLSSEGHMLKCDFSDSVDWLRPRKLRNAIKQATPGATKQDGAGQKWCPFMPSASKGAEVSSSK